MKTYETLTEGLADLQKQGYTTDFNLEPGMLKCKTTQKTLSAAEFEVVGVYHFDGMTNPDDEVVLYAIESKDHTMKGTLVNAYGMYTDSAGDELIRKLTIKRP